MVKEKVDIIKVAVGITNLRKGGKGSIIIGCESEREIKQMKDTICEKLGDDFEITKTKKIKPKIKIINVGEEEMKLNDKNLVHTIKKQNKIDGKKEGFYIRVEKRIIREGREGDTRTRRGNNEEDSLILQVDEVTHELMRIKRKINIGGIVLYLITTMSEDVLNIGVTTILLRILHGKIHATSVQRIIRQVNVRQQRRDVLIMYVQDQNI